MTITEARSLTRRNVIDQSARADDDFVDDAIILAGDEFCRQTGAIVRADSVTITANSSVFPVTTPVANGFRTDRLIDVCIATIAEPLKVVDYPALNALVADGVPDGSSSGPTHLGFSTQTGNGTLWPTPTAAFTATLRYWQPFGVTVSGTWQQGWTAGTATAGTLAGTINVPDDLLRNVLILGACAILKFSDKEQAYGSVEWGRFTDWLGTIKGVMGLGVTSIQRNPAGGTRRPRRVRILSD